MVELRTAFVIQWCFWHNSERTQHRQEYQNKEEGKDHESLQSRTTPDPGHRM